MGAMAVARHRLKERTALRVCQSVLAVDRTRGAGKLWDLLDDPQSLLESDTGLPTIRRGDVVGALGHALRAIGVQKGQRRLGWLSVRTSWTRAR